MSCIIVEAQRAFDLEIHYFLILVYKCIKSVSRVTPIKPSLKTYISGAPQGSEIGPILLSTFPKIYHITYEHCFSGEMPRMPRRAQNSISRRARLPNQRNPAKILGASHRNNRRTTRPHQRPGHGAMQCLFRKGVLQLLLPL